MSSKHPIGEDTGVTYMHDIIVICLCISFSVIHKIIIFRSSWNYRDDYLCYYAYSHLETNILLPFLMRYILDFEG